MKPTLMKSPPSLHIYACQHVGAKHPHLTRFQTPTETRLSPLTFLKEEAHLQSVPAATPVLPVVRVERMAFQVLELAVPFEAW